jgi:hypothetical protein
MRTEAAPGNPLGFSKDYHASSFFELFRTDTDDGTVRSNDSEAPGTREEVENSVSSFRRSKDLLILLILLSTR